MNQMYGRRVEVRLPAPELAPPRTQLLDSFSRDGEHPQPLTMMTWKNQMD